MFYHSRLCFGPATVSKAFFGGEARIVSSLPRKKSADKQIIYNLILSIYNLKLRI